MSVRAGLKEIEEALKEAQTQQEKLRIIIELGEDLETTPRTSFIGEDKVPGCASEAFVRARLEEGKVRYEGFSASLIIKGYLAVLLEALDNNTPETISDSEEDIKGFITQTGVESASMVPSRTNSFSRLYRFMKEKAEQLVE